jgi:O-antigen/teichoic acid export membrane protein
MILFTILLLTLLLLIVVGVVLFSVFGAGVIIIFGDVIVCAIFIIWIIKKLIAKKRK